MQMLFLMLLANLALLYLLLISVMRTNSSVSQTDVSKTLFATTQGTFVSKVMQQGDCNAPSTWQRFMVWVFRERCFRTVYPWMDDIWLITLTLHDHEDGLKYIHTCLQMRFYGSRPRN
jgi:hypothetical protein